MPWIKKLSITVEKQEKSIAVLICYYGNFPWYFAYFLESCKFNPTVNFIIITDNLAEDFSLPENILFVPSTLDGFNSLASQKLGLNTNIITPYKICDFKPAFGLIFEDLIEEYDFWGHGDIDVIFGNIRGFITEDLLSRYDLISIRPDWMPGCFLLFKNEQKMINLFSQSKDYRRVFTVAEYLNFDETSFGHQYFYEGKTYDKVKTEVESMLHVVKRLEQTGSIKPYFDLFMIEGLPGRMKWQQGALVYNNKYEILLFHLIYMKNIFFPKGNIRIKKMFRISPARIY
jgi:hypothetical protein